MGLIPFLSPISIVQQMVVAPSEFDFEKAVSRLREAIDKDFGKGNKETFQNRSNYYKNYI